MNVHFCPECGRLNLADFRYCPYCGSQAARGPDLDDLLEAPFAKMEKQVETGVLRDFAALEAKLSSLESDLELLMEELANPSGPKQA